MDRYRAMVMAPFVADALALGVHWEYNTDRLMKTHRRVESFKKPALGSYHETKDLGGFTHYGDQALVLLESVAANKGFDLSDFSARWRALFESYNGFIDGATRATLANYAAGKAAAEAGSNSDDLAGAGRIAPLVHCYRNDPDRLVESARAQTQMTHNNPLVADSSEFYARVTLLVLDGAPPTEAMGRVARDNFDGSKISTWFDEGLASKDEDSTAAIAKFGQTCHTPAMFPGIVHLIAKFENDLKEAMVQSIMVGGDNAARGMIVGMVLGAHLGWSGIPDEWLTQLKKRSAIETLLSDIL